MSLKAKLEAVIYAAEEPVTLGQLAALFAADALEFKAAQEAAAREQTAEVAGLAVAPTDPAPLLAEGLEFLNLADSPGVYPESAPQDEPPPSEPAAPSELEPSTAAEGAPEASAEPTAQLDAESPSETPAEPPTTPEAAEDQPAADPFLPESGDVPSEPAAEDTQPAGEADSDAPIDLEAEARKLARQRDREIRTILKQILDEIIAESASDSRGVEIREIAGGYRMATKPECHDAVRMFVKSLKPAMKLSLPALETLAVVAYKQPVTAPEVSEIRGVESAGVLGSLLSRKLIATAGRKQVIGRPILYKTTREFLLRFGLKDLTELPSMEEFEKMAGIEIEEAPADETTHAGDQALLQASSPDGEELAVAIAGSATDQPPTEAEPAEADPSDSDSAPELPDTESAPPAASPATMGEAPASAEDASEEAAGDPASGLGSGEVEPAELETAETDAPDESAATKNADTTQPGDEPGQAEIEASRDGKEDEEER